MSRADIHSISHNPDHNHRDKKQANPSSLARMSADFLPALHIRGSHYDIGHRMVCIILISLIKITLAIRL